MKTISVAAGAPRKSNRATFPWESRNIWSYHARGCAAAFFPSSREPHNISFHSRGIPTILISLHVCSLYPYCNSDRARSLCCAHFAPMVHTFRRALQHGLPICIWFSLWIQRCRSLLFLTDPAVSNHDALHLSLYRRPTCGIAVSKAHLTHLFRLHISRQHF